MFPLVVQFLPRIEKKPKTQKMHSKVTAKLQLLASLQAGRPSPCGGQARVEGQLCSIFNEAFFS